MKNTSPEVDRYIENAAPFAQPILEKIRKAFHQAHPDVSEVMKWSVPHFEYKGVLGSMAAFKAHVAWGFWKAKLMDDPHGILQAVGQETTSMGMAKVASVEDLPPDDVMVDYVRQAVKLNEDGVKIERPKREPKADVATPDDLAAALKKSPAAKKAWDAFAPSHRREYVNWITEARQEATRSKRVAQTVEWVGEGKSRNWKYEKR